MLYGLVIWFSGVRYQDTPPLVVNVMLELFNNKPVKVSPEEDVLKLFDVPINKNNSTPIIIQVRNHHAYHGICPADIGITFNKSKSYPKNILKLLMDYTVP